MGQLCSTTSLSHNLAQCQVLVRKAVTAGAKVGICAFYTFILSLLAIMKYDNLFSPKTICMATEGDFFNAKWNRKAEIIKMFFVGYKHCFDRYEAVFASADVRPNVSG